jgi:oxygen-dependent protoporphyrinogen oxidase
LSVKSAFPKLYRLEELYGGLIKGMIKGVKERKKAKEKSKQSAKMFSFKNGMQSFPKAIAKSLPGSIILNAKVKTVYKNNGSYKIVYEKDSIQFELEANIILATIPASATGKIFSTIDTKLSDHMDSIFYPPVIVLYLGYPINEIPIDLDGFGYLIPSLEEKNFLGAIWNSTIFENRAPKDFASFTLFIGGSKNPNLFEKPNEEIIETAIREFSQIMRINSKPVIIKEKSWQKAIPQYNIGYVEHENYFEKFEQLNPGLFLSGNYKGGISVGDCIKSSQMNSYKVNNYLKNKL